MHAFLNTAFQGVLQAATLMNQAQERLDQVQVSEKNRNDFVSEVDKASEQILVECIKKAYPDHGILAEEGGEHVKATEHQWIIDPLDGTTNFIHGLPHFCISIALKIKDKIEHGLVYDPIRQELFTATRGSGCYFNDRKRLRVSNKTELTGALLGIGSPKREPNEPPDVETYLKPITQLYGDVAGFRRGGSAALDLAYVAAGRLDGYWESGLKIWDIAAGALLVKEAGGLVSDYDGDHQFLARGEIVASAPKLLKQILPTLSDKGSKR